MCVQALHGFEESTLSVRNSRSTRRHPQHLCDLCYSIRAGRPSHSPKYDARPSQIRGLQHGFGDLSEAGYGVAIASRDKYGYAVEGSTLRYVDACTRTQYPSSKLTRMMLGCQCYDPLHLRTPKRIRANTTSPSPLSLIAASSQRAMSLLRRQSSITRCTVSDVVLSSSAVLNSTLSIVCEGE